MPELLMRRATTLTRFKRADKALAAWDEYDAAQQLPQESRQKVAKPLTSRTALETLKAMLEESLQEMNWVSDLRS